MFKRICKSRFVTASFWVYLATIFINGGNYLYHLIMGRFLGPAQYGELATAISLLYILNIPLLTATFVIIKFTSEYKGKNAFEVISDMHQYLEHSIFKYGLIFTLCLVLFSRKINMFFHLSSEILFIFVAINFFIGFFPIINKSILQGSTDFFGFAFTSIGEIIAKLVCAILFVLAGFKVVGAFAGILLSGLIAYFISLFFIKRLKRTTSIFQQKRKLLFYAIPVFFVNLGFTSLFTSDILLVRHFFSGIDSGYYASLSVLSKIIFYAVNPFVSIMLPLVSENHAKGHSYIKYLFLTISISPYAETERDLM